MFLISQTPKQLMGKTGQKASERKKHKLKGGKGDVENLIKTKLWRPARNIIVNNLHGQ